MIRFKVTLQNAGQTPAENVMVALSMFDDTNGWLILARDKQRDICAPIRAVRPENEAGATIFPGQASILSAAARISKADLQRALTAPNPPVPAARFPGTLLPVAVGCIDYLFAWSRFEHHQTPVAYMLLRRDNRGAEAALSITFDANTRMIPGNQLWLQKHTIEPGDALAD